MEPFEVLKMLENCYDLLKPADENSHEAFTWFSEIPHPLFNVVMHFSCDRFPEKKIDALIEQSKNCPFSFWVHPLNTVAGLSEILKERQFTSAVTCSLMVWDTESVAKPKREVRSANIGVFKNLLATIFHMNEKVKEGYGKLMENHKFEHHLIEIDGKPVAIGSLFSHGQVGGIFNVGTLPEYRRKGYGKAMTEFLMHRADTKGLKQLVLLSSPEAENLYSNLGFKKVCPIEIFAH